MSSDDPFGEAAGLRLAKTSKRQYQSAWRRFLGFLALEEPSALEIAPAERLTVERIRAFVTHLAATNIPRSVAIQVDALYKAARAILPQHDWIWFKSIKTRLYVAAPAGPPAGPVITSVQLLDLGLQLMDESRPSANRSKNRTADLVRYRDGLMIALLGFIPLRRKNVAIEIGRHFVQDGDGWSVIIPCAETKTGTPIEFAVPQLLGPYLATYLNVVRPRLLRRPCNALWISQKGGALSYSAIWGVIYRHTAKRLDVRIAPHDVRDAAATTWAIHAPDQIGIARDLLAHSDLRPTTRHYNRARGIEASRTYAQLIDRRRRQRSR